LHSWSSRCHKNYRKMIVRGLENIPRLFSLKVKRRSSSNRPKAKSQNKESSKIKQRTKKHWSFLPSAATFTLVLHFYARIWAYILSVLQSFNFFSQSLTLLKNIRLWSMCVGDLLTILQYCNAIKDVKLM
jgi:hypothetical protein